MLNKLKPLNHIFSSTPSKKIKLGGKEINTQLGYEF
jgi:hypothetical protein